MSQPPPEFYQAFPRQGPVCRGCGAAVTVEEFRCEACGTVRPALAEFHGEGYEWRTEATWMGFPWVHIAFGMDAQGHGRRAQGMLAVGQNAIGAVAIGVMARGFVSLGVVSMGVFSFGVVALGALFAAGVNAAAPYAVGVVAFGYYAGGLAPWGWKILFSGLRP